MFKPLTQKGLGAFWVAAAALLWSTDAVFRTLAIQSLAPAQVVFIEHLICVGVLLLGLVFGKRKWFEKKPTASEWVGLVIVGAGGSAAATVLFTLSFYYTNPSVAILLQKLQPVLVVLIAYLFLGERPRGKFYLWAALAVVAGIGVSFPGYHLGVEWKELTSHSVGALLAVSAAAIWAICTVVGKAVLKQVSPPQITFWRFVFGLAAMALILTLQNMFSGLTGFTYPPKLLAALLYMALFPGLVSMLFYYRGLKRTPASLATMVELVFPVSAVLLNYVLLDARLAVSQIICGVVLLWAITRLSLGSITE